MFHSLKSVLRKAQKGKYAVGAFNVNNMEFVQAVIAAGERMKSPVIISTSEGAIKYAGLKYLYAMAKVAAKAKIPVVLHLDHGRDFKIIKDVIKIGYTSVMYDGSHLSFAENVKNTKKVVQLARKKGVSVEGELGTIGGAEDTVSAREIIYTNPLAAKDFVRETGVDALAIAIGTSHGAYKFKGASKLDIARLQDIKQLVKVPLVLHGASGVPKYLVGKAQKYGAELGKPSGVSDLQIRKAVKYGICKVNEDTDLRLAFLASVRETLSKKPAVFDPRKILGPSREYVQRIIEDRMKVLGSRRKA